MKIERRQFLHGIVGATAFGAFGDVQAQGTSTLTVPWMAWPENQVRPLMDVYEKATGVKIAEERLQEPFKRRESDHARRKRWIDQQILRHVQHQ